MNFLKISRLSIARVRNCGFSKKLLVILVNTQVSDAAIQLFIASELKKMKGAVMEKTDNGEDTGRERSESMTEKFINGHSKDSDVETEEEDKSQGHLTIEFLFCLGAECLEK